MHATARGLKLCEWCEVNEHRSCTKILAGGRVCKCHMALHPRQPIQRPAIFMPESYYR